MSFVNVKMFKKVVALLTMSLVLTSFGYIFTSRAAGTEKELTDDEKAAFIVRDEWTSWVKEFTASLSELDRLATAKIYDGMDFYDMQYRFTEKYKKVPEYLDEDGKPTQKLKDMIKEKRKKIAKGGSGAQTKDYLHFKSKKDGSKLKYVINGTLAAAPNIGYSLDNGETWVIWSANTDVTVDNDKTVLVQNKAETLSSSESDYVQFVMTDATFEVSGDCSSMIHFANPKPYCFYKLFADQTALKTAPELPSTTLSNSCYKAMFKGCVNLTSPPSALEATSVPDSAYSEMFSGCVFLQNTPNIQATSVGNNACYAMFKGCTTITKSTELPATTLGAGCYSNMFEGCTSLQGQPFKKLPAKTASANAYYQMFKGSTQLNVAPEILATTVGNNAMYEMFYNCNNLERIRMNYTGNFNSNFTNWCYGVAEPLPNNFVTGELYYKGADKTMSESAIPINWVIVDENADYLIFKGEQNNSRIRFVGSYGFNRYHKMYYLKSGETDWKRWERTTWITLNKGDTIKVWNRRNELSWSYEYYLHFEMEGKLAASGNINSMINFSNTVEDSAFIKMFAGCSQLISAPEFPATTLAPNCYEETFMDCTNLETPPSVLPATLLPSQCYKRMFVNCGKLKYAPSFNATEGSGYKSCYQMFNECRELASANVVLSATVSEACYEEMFRMCQPLSNVSEDMLPAMELAPFCYRRMFNGCRITNMPKLPATKIAESCYEYMFSVCEYITEFPDELPATTLYPNCYKGMFYYTKITKAPKLPAAKMEESCYEEMFNTCRELTEVSDFGATELAPNCFKEMFRGATKLRNVSLVYQGNFSTDYFDHWLYNVSGSGDFYYTGERVDRGHSAIPNNWTIHYPPFYFQSEQDGSTVRFIKFDTTSETQIYTSTDLVNWTKWEQNVNITLNNGEKLYVKNNESILSEDGNWTEFRMTGLIGAHGNINCLRNEDPVLNAYAFKQLFNSCSSLTTPPMLTSETLADFCYYNMFKGCTNLRRAPELRAKTLKTACYQNMFEDCENMVTGPEILPATVATDYCYNTMFHGCSSLIKGPHIKITTIGTTTRQIMQNMFDSCTVLEEIKLDYTSNDYIGQEYHFRNWVYGVAADGTFYYNGSYTGRGPNGIPDGWAIVTY